MTDTTIRTDVYGFTWARRDDGQWESAYGTVRPDPRFTWNEDEE
ncbi:hypothetical protein [Corynebacterium xerosis]|nr:hypothetical protein [Corynebacterium xerosis]